MTRKLIAPAPFEILVADVTRRRGGFRYQQVQTPGSRVTNALMTGDPVASTGTITVDSAVFGTTDVAATGSLTVVDTVAVPITLTINGNALVGTNGARTPGSDDFNVNGTPETVAVDIAAAINDAANSFDTDVVATTEGSKVCLVAATAGFGAIDIASSDTSMIVTSGEELTGGFQAGAESKTFQIGDYTFIPGVNWEVVEGDDVTTAGNLATAISNLPGFAATNGGTSTVTITGPTQGGCLLLSTSAEANFTANPATGELTRTPSVGPPVIF